MFLFSLFHTLFRYIQQALSLKRIDPNLFQGIHSLKFLHIKQSGLVEVPNIIFTHQMIDIVDFDTNQITILRSNSVSIKANEVYFDYNLIESIQDFAFNGSSIAKLSLKGNNKLTQLSDSCFNGISHLRTLDLSETSITKLPTSGLKNLQILKLIHTYTLKVIPSVYHFNKIKRAFLTYPHHCCAFKFPSTHDQSSEYNLQIQKHHKECQELNSKNQLKKKSHFVKKIDSTTTTPAPTVRSTIAKRSILSNGDKNSIVKVNFVSTIKTDSSSNGKSKKTFINNNWVVSLLPNWTVKLVNKFFGQNKLKVSKISLSSFFPYFIFFNKNFLQEVN